MRSYITLAAILLGVGAAAAAGPAGPPVLLKSEDLPVAVEPAALQAQFDALTAMPPVQVEYSIRGPVTSIRGATGVVLPASVRQLTKGASARFLLDEFGPVLLATGRESLTVRENQLWVPGRHQLSAEQHIDGIPVIGAQVAVEIDVPSGRVQELWASFLPGRNLPKKKKAALSAANAWQALVRALEASGDAVPGTARQGGKPTLAYFGVLPDSIRGQLVWSINVGFECPTGRQDSERVLVDAIDGMVVARQSNISYFQSPGPCQLDEDSVADCEIEPDPSLGDAPYSSSCTGSVKPHLTVTRIDCSNSFRLSWPRIPGASQYHVMRAPAELGWAFARTVVGGYVHQCTTQVDAPNMVRMRPCDGCGCGEWSKTLIMDPQAKCP